MSVLGEEIRAQERAVRQVSNRLNDDAARLRKQLSATVWQSRAGDAFRAALDRLERDLTSAAAEVEELAEALAHHATTVESHEDAAVGVAKWPFEQVGKAVGAGGDAVRHGAGAFERGIERLTRVS